MSSVPLKLGGSWKLGHRTDSESDSAHAINRKKGALFIPTGTFIVWSLKGFCRQGECCGCEITGEDISSLHMSLHERPTKNSKWVNSTRHSLPNTFTANNFTTRLLWTKSSLVKLNVVSVLACADNKSNNGEHYKLECI